MAKGKENPRKQIDKQVEKIKALYPKARYTGVSDGAPDLATWLKRHTGLQVLDHYHAAACLDLASPAFCPRPEEAAASAALARAGLLGGEGMAATLLKEREGLRDSREVRPLCLGA